MPTGASRLYRGVVAHTRLRPTRHVLRRRIPMLLVDLDDLPNLRSRLLAVDRFGPLSIEARHHLSGENRPLKPQVEARLAAAGLEAGGAIRLLCMPAVFGRVFNPLSLYFCHTPDGALSAILYEVSNTFGGRHCYALGVTPGAGTIRQTCDKTFHVSPFIDMDMTYAFAVSPPGERVHVGIKVSDRTGPLLTATFDGAAEPLTTRALAGVLARHPLLMFQVLGGIHWEAIKMLCKGIRLRPPPPPEAMGWRPARSLARRR